ncbi:TonB-dependent receptor [Niveispirillum irakense]|uniref:TonB-dependent receptor n=1 Tax=Niveispirillum irakense TaxID=34011 RepID=UPI00048C05E1|nr:TonB-dependent siderophore receptor [Niveispirillum irakense]
MVRGRLALMAALSAGVVSAMATPAAMAQQTTAGNTGGATVLPALRVDGQGLSNGNKPERAASPKYTSNLRDTPQTITVVPEAVIREQNLLTLRDILSTVPGITFGAGEGGGGYGDSINLRGYSANSDIAVDGIRDSAQYVRSDPFNLEQLEVTNGANSVYAGSGSVGGSINLVSKTAKDDVFTTASAGIGTDSYYRATVDTNQKIDDNTAVRLNGMWHRNDVPGRDVEKYKRWGVAPSVTLGLATDTQFTLSYFHQEDKNVPQYGVPYFKNAFHDGMLPGVDSENYYGYANVDKQDSEADMVTAKLVHAFTDRLSVENMTRWQRVTQFAVVNPPQGTWCLADGTNASTGAACAARGTYTPSGPRGNTRDTRNTMLFNQTDVKAKLDTGSISHNITLGAAVFSEKFHLDTGNSLRNPGGATPNPTLPVMTIENPNNTWSGPVNFIRTATQDGTLENQAVYLFDTMNVTDQFDINAGVRWEHNKGDYTSGTYSAQGVFQSQTEKFENTDSLFSYRVGAVYKPLPNGSVYIAYGNSKTPSKSAVNGTCTTGTGAALINNCNVDPETAKNYEIGTKWDLLDNQLSVTASIFRNERTNYKVPSADPLVPEYQLDGKSRVDGVSLGVAGTVTEEWRIFANYTYLDSEVLQSVADGLATDAQKGNPLTSTPKHSGSLWTTYDLPFNVQLGYGATYTGAAYFNNSGTTLYKSDSYWVHRASAAYFVNEEVEVRLNVNNLFDKLYFTRARNNGWATPGDARSATLTVNYTF